MNSELIDAIKNMEFRDLREVLVATTNRLKDLTNEDNLLFKKLLGQFISLTVSDSTESKLDQMQLIVDYQYNHLNSFKQNLIRTCYGASEDNLGMLQICFPFEVTAFIKYGRENINILAMQIQELKEQQ